MDRPQRIMEIFGQISVPSLTKGQIIDEQRGQNHGFELPIILCYGRSGLAKSMCEAQSPHRVDRHMPYRDIAADLFGEGWSERDL